MVAASTQVLNISYIPREYESSQAKYSSSSADLFHNASLQISRNREKTPLGEKSVPFNLHGKIQLTGRTLLLVEAYP